LAPDFLDSIYILSEIRAICQIIYQKFDQKLWKQPSRERESSFKLNHKKWAKFVDINYFLFLRIWKQSFNIKIKLSNKGYKTKRDFKIIIPCKSSLAKEHPVPEQGSQVLLVPEL
jgi:hypothetical protein